MERGAVDGELVDATRVFERDGYRCGICGRKTLPSKRGSTHERAPELDHIIAIALGGEHRYSNVQCACRSCNGKKGAASLGQMHLFPAG
ncbi:HNH endonuclease [Paracoccus sp. NGMCC 1.201697]|uniref:HNH endonuclease n=1 Tax=Paracoccus broussonetiae subsp. drimophilus TaxID=3373869 RepID=A0ABW7LH93_9RHOB